MMSTTNQHFKESNLDTVNKYILYHRGVKRLQAKRKPLFKKHICTDNELYLFYSFMIDILIDKELIYYVKLKYLESLN
jgi:hypothetical protein